MAKFRVIVGMAGYVLGVTDAMANRPWAPGGPPPPGPAPCGIPIKFFEEATPGLIATYEVVATDCHGNIIPGFKRKVSGQNQVEINVRGTINGVLVGDAGNRTLSNVHARKNVAGTMADAESDPGAAESVLDIESLYRNPITRLWQFEGANGLIRAEFGNGVFVPIPDVYADTNGDGVIGSGDTLYSWVDLRVYTQAKPTFDFGDTYPIVNGEIAELPGMWFSSTPIFLDPLLGPQPTGGSWYNSNPPGFALTGGEAPGVYSEHDVSTMPEPQSWSLLVSGFGLIAISLRSARGRRLNRLMSQQ